MKKTLNKFAVAAVCSMLWASPQAEANSCYQTPAPVYDMSSLPAQSSTVGAPYEDVMAWCQNWITDLQNARWRANLEARNGYLDRAANMLYDALSQKGPQLGFPNPAPNTADAIRVGINMAVETMSATDDRGIPARLRGELRYLMLDSIFEFVEWAYYGLDQRFYRQVFDHCGRGGGPGCQGGIAYLPMEYYDGVRQLALRLLNLQIQLAPLQASDVLELRIARAVSAGSRDILLSSVLRRNLACPINKLTFTVDQINSFLACSGTSLPRREQVEVVRSLLVDARNTLASADCGFNNNNQFPQYPRR